MRSTYRANPDRTAIGTVLEGRLDKRRGPLATVLVQNGTLNTGDIVVVGRTWGKIRALEDENSARHRTAPPATPTVIIGLHDVPNAGDIMEVVGDERTARAIAEKRSEEAKQQELSRPSRPLSLDDFSSAIRAGQAQELSVVLKTDVQGSIEPIVNSITRLSTDNIKVNVIHAAAGNISESDMNLALASDAIVLGFRVSADAAALRMADMERMEIHIYEIIYRLVDDVEKALKVCWSPPIPRSPLARPMYARSSTFRASARSLDAMSPRVWRGATPKCACFATIPFSMTGQSTRSSASPRMSVRFVRISSVASRFRDSMTCQWAIGCSFTPCGASSRSRREVP